MKTCPLAGAALAAALAATVAGCGRPGEAELAAGRRELARGRAVRARDLLDRAIQARPGDPSNAEAYNLLGLACHAIGDAAAAARAFEESRRLDPAFAAPYYNLACMYRDAGQLDRATELFSEAARLAPSDSRPLEMIARLHATHRQWNDAAARWQEAYARDPRSARILASLAEVELQRVGPAAAISYLGKALEVDPRYAPALYNLYAIHAYALGNPDAAEPYARQFADVSPPEDPRAAGVRAWLEQRRGVGNRTGRPPSSVPATATTVGTSAPQIPAGTSAVAAVPAAPPPAEPVTAARMLEDARRLLGRGRTNEAVARALEAAVRAAAESDAAAEERAVRLALQWAPEEPSVHLALGRWHERRRQLEEARRAYAEAAARAPNLAEAHRSLARVALRLDGDDLDAAVVSLRRLLQIEPDDPEARWTLAGLYDHTLRLPAEARREYEEFARRFPEEPRTLTATERLRALAPPPAVTAVSPPTVAAQQPPPAPAAAFPPPPVPPPTGRQLQLRTPATRDVRAATEAFNRAYQHHRRGDLDAAAREYIRAIELDHQHVPAYYNLGDVYLRRNDLDLARDAYRRALELSPDHAQARYNLAYAMDLLGESAAAREQVAYLTARDPNHAGAQYLLGLLSSRPPANLDTARRAFRRFLELAPNDPKAAGVRQWLAQNPAP